MLTCDYLKFTFKFERLDCKVRDAIEYKLVSSHGSDYTLSDFDVFLEVFPEIKKHISEFNLLNFSRFYKRIHAFSDICYIYDDGLYKGRKGVNVEFPAHGLSTLRKWFGLERDADYFRTILNILRSRACTFSRIDICHDVPIESDTLRPSDYLQWLVNGQIKSHYQAVFAVGNSPEDFIIKSYFSGSGVGGATFYIGSRRHQMLRIYDKSVQSNGAYNVIRYEIETHREKAQAIVDSYLKEDFDFSAILLDMIDVLAYSKELGNSSCIKREARFDDFVKQEFKQKDIIIVSEYDKKTTYASKIKWALSVYDSILSIEYLDEELTDIFKRKREFFLKFLKRNDEENDIGVWKEIRDDIIFRKEV